MIYPYACPVLTMSATFFYSPPFLVQSLLVICLTCACGGSFRLRMFAVIRISMLYGLLAATISMHDPLVFQVIIDLLFFNFQVIQPLLKLPSFCSSFNLFVPSWMIYAFAEEDYRKVSQDLQFCFECQSLYIII